MTNEVLKAALQYAKMYQWHIFPLTPYRKEPLGRLAPNGFLNAVTNALIIRDWWKEEPSAGIGCATGSTSGIFVVDADVKDGATGDVSLRQLEKEFGELPATPTSRTPTGGRHYFFAYPTDVNLRCSVGKFASGIDIRADGGYAVLPPTKNGSGGYEWIVPPTNVPPHAAPAWLIKRAIETQAGGNGTQPGPSVAYIDDESDIQKGNRNNELASIAGRLKRAGQLTNQEVFITLSAINKKRCKPPLSPVEVKRIAISSGRYAVHTNAQQQEIAVTQTEEHLVGYLNMLFGPVEVPPLDKVLAALRSEESGDSRLAIALHGEKTLYYSPDKTWYVFDGLHWKAFPAKAIRQAVVGRVAIIYAKTATWCMEQVNKGDTQHRSAADGMVKRAAALMHVRRQKDIIDNIEGALTRNSDERNPTTFLEWDADPNLFAVQNGVIDLRTGMLRKCEPTDYIRTVAPVAWRSINEPCPMWDLYMSHVHSEDAELVGFMQRLFGYAMTGHARDHYVTILYGRQGRNGKGVELEVIGKILGNYALSVSKGILIDSGRRSAPSAATPHLAQLRGKRFVWTSETKEDERADAGLLKYLSGEDTVNARDLYESGGHTFTPTHTIFLATNYKPHLPASDDATWERIITVEYKRRYLDDPNPALPNEFPRDPTIKERLLGEKEGILAWLVRGAMEWAANGLMRPQSTKTATRSYRIEEDWALRWIEARCIVDPKESVPAGLLYSDFLNWWDRSDRAPSQAAFGRRLNDLGYTKSKDPKTTRTVRNGIRLASVATTLDQEIDFGRDDE
jgi:putative DNA primase/helicase